MPERVSTAVAAPRPDDRPGAMPEGAPRAPEVPQEPPPEPWSVILVLPSDDEITLGSVVRLLVAEGIPWRGGGSFYFSMEVPSSHVGAAERVLRAHPDLVGFLLWTRETGEQKSAQGVRKEVRVDLTFDQALVSPDYPPDSIVGRLLRDPGLKGGIERSGLHFIGVVRWEYRPCITADLKPCTAIAGEVGFGKAKNDRWSGGFWRVNLWSLFP